MMSNLVNWYRNSSRSLIRKDTKPVSEKAAQIWCDNMVSYYAQQQRNAEVSEPIRTRDTREPVRNSDHTRKTSLTNY